MQKKSQNHRIPLEKGTALTKNLVIESLLSDCGGSSLTYLARKSSGAVVVVKESFPLFSTVPLYRRQGEYRILPTEYGDAFLEEQKELQQRFSAECSNADILSSEGDANSIFHFESTDITDEVTADPNFSGTAARYMTIATVFGRTLRQIEEQDEISLRQAFLYGKKILFSLSRMHAEPKKMLHLDIKDENLFFSGELPREETFAILLDCGSALKIEEVAEASRFSISNSFAAREVQLLKKYSSGLTKNDASAKKYRTLIGTHTDLYSVGAVLYRLILGDRFDLLEWNEINGQDDPKEKEKLLYQAVEGRLKTAYPYLVERVTRMLARAMYFSSRGQQLLQNRYKTCEEFAAELQTLLEILDQKGIHPEIMAAQSRGRFAKILHSSGIAIEGNISSNEDLLQREDLFVREWFPPVTEE